MQQIKYGLLPFDVVRTIYQEVTPIMSEDKMEYLHSMVVIEVIALLNPQVASFDKGLKINGIFSAPVSSEGNYGATTAANIRHYLAQPRQVLTITNTNGDIWLSSPKLNPDGIPYDCDPKGGPFCEVLGTPQIHSDRTWEWHLRFTTYIRECSDDPNLDKFVLSNRYTQNMDVDELGFTTITTQGRVIVDLSVGINDELTPDAFRNAYFFTLPTGFQRQIRVTQSSDGTTLDYTTVDTEKSHGYTNNIGLQRVEITTSRGFESRGSVDIAINTGLQLADLTLSNVSSLANSIVQASISERGAVTAAGVALTQAAIVQAAAVANITAHTIVDTFPRFFLSINVKCFGSPTARRRDLTSIALAIAFSKIPFVRAFDFWTSSIMVNELHAGPTPYSEVTMRIQSTLASAIKLIGSDTLPARTAQNALNKIGAAALTTGAFSLLLNMLRDDEVINASTAAGGNITVDLGANLPPPPGDQISRGTYLEKLVFQALKSGCASVKPLNDEVDLEEYDGVLP